MIDVQAQWTSLGLGGELRKLSCYHDRPSWCVASEMGEAREVAARAPSIQEPGAKTEDGSGSAYRTMARPSFGPIHLHCLFRASPRPSYSRWECTDKCL